MPPKAPTEIDRLVGSRVRHRRLQIRMSQEALAAALEITVPQVQKYEKGTNRIGASRLHTIARILDMPIGFFFGEAEATGMGNPESPDLSLFADRAVVELALAFSRIASPQMRRALLDLARAVTSEPLTAADPANKAPSNQSAA